MMVLVDKFSYIFKEWLPLIRPSYDEPEMIMQDDEDTDSNNSKPSPYNLQQQMST
jgi:hypothetical protein